MFFEKLKAFANVRHCYTDTLLQQGLQPVPNANSGTRYIGAPNPPRVESLGGVLTPKTGPRGPTGPWRQNHTKPGSCHQGGEAIEERTTTAQDRHHHDSMTVAPTRHSLQSSVLILPRIISRPPGEGSASRPIQPWGNGRWEKSKAGPGAKELSHGDTLHSACNLR